MNSRFAMFSFLAVLAGLTASPALQAQQAVDEHREARPGASIEFRAVSGEFRFVGTERDALEISGTIGPEVEELRISGDPDAWIVEVRYFRNFRNARPAVEATSLVISLPRSAELVARAVSGDLDLAGLEGARVEANTVSGDVNAAGVSPERLAVETVSGRIRIDGGGRADNRLKSVSGTITVDDLGERAQIQSVSGNLELASGELRDLDAESVSGRIHLAARPGDRAQIRLASHSGDVTVALPAATPLDLRARSFSGRIRSDFGGQVQRGRGPGERVEHRAGGGEVRLEVSSFSGDVRVEAGDH